MLIMHAISNVSGFILYMHTTRKTAFRYFLQTVSWFIFESFFSIIMLGVHYFKISSIVTFYCLYNQRALKNHFTVLLFFLVFTVPFYVHNSPFIKFNDAIFQSIKFTFHHEQTSFAHGKISQMLKSSACYSVNLWDRPISNLTL